MELVKQLPADAYLKERHVRFEVVPHTSTYTASSEARAMGLPGDYVLKVVILRLDEGYAMAIVPASRRLDLSLVSRLFPSKSFVLPRRLRSPHVFLALIWELCRPCQVSSDSARTLIRPYSTSMRLPSQTEAGPSRSSPALVKCFGAKTFSLHRSQESWRYGGLGVSKVMPSALTDESSAQGHLEPDTPVQIHDSWSIYGRAFGSIGLRAPPLGSKYPDQC